MATPFFGEWLKEREEKGKGMEREGKERQLLAQPYYNFSHKGVVPSTWLLLCTVLIMGQWRLKCKCKEREREGKGKGRIGKGEMNEGKGRKERHARRRKGDMKERIEKEREKKKRREGEGEGERKRERERIRKKERKRVQERRTSKDWNPTAKRERGGLQKSISYTTFSDFFLQKMAQVYCEWVECHLLFIYVYIYILFLCLKLYAYI